MALRIDAAAERTFALVLSDLRSARLDAGLSQPTLASGLPVIWRTISDWENGSAEPTFSHLIQWSRALRRRLVIVGRDGELRSDPVRHRAGESWVLFERRRLVAPLRHRRTAMGLSQTDFGGLVGVSRDSIQRWELVRVAPSSMAKVVWAQTAGYALAVRPIDD